MGLFDGKEFLMWMRCQEPNCLEGQGSQFGHSMSVLNSSFDAGQYSQNKHSFSRARKRHQSQPVCRQLLWRLPLTHLSSGNCTSLLWAT